jgi:replicative DNA helicase
LKNPEKLIDIKGHEVKGEMFLIEANKYIFYAIDYLFNKKQEPTPIAITEVLKDKHAKEVVEEFGGVEYISILADQRVSENNIDILCDKLKQAYTKKELLTICSESVSHIMSERTEVMNPTEIINIVESKIVELTTEVQQTTEIYKMGDNAEHILELRAENPETIPGLEIGWKKFDYYTNGGQPGDLIMVCARAKTGKSTLLTNWATKLGIKDKLPVLYFDTEMDSRQQEDRILSILSGIPHKEIVSGMYVLDTENGKAKDKKEKLKKAIEELHDGNYYHIYLPNFTIESVTAIAKKFKIQNDIQAIFFDYLKFPAGQLTQLKNAQEWQMLGYIASGLKDLAGTLEIPIYSACQENRIDPKGDKKSEINVGGSDRILQLASKLIFLSNKSEEEMMRLGELNGNQTLYIAYQRNGESDVPYINIKFDRPRLTQIEV